ncbi:uncharacterized protein LOC113566468 [Drosophila persimilis]|uniref:uncharacterized protein LOC113566468 n=1 Tax=Drosophila persimilis TaxID=7234 RepID=UPI000F08F92F|nr:uncharacterized protein LOC113566468 [Drosophila persimilis]
MDGHSVVFARLEVRMDVVEDCGDIEQFQEVVAPTGPLHERGSNSNEVASDGRRTFERRQTIPKYVWHRRDLTPGTNWPEKISVFMYSVDGRKEHWTGPCCHSIIAT